MLLWLILYLENSKANISNVSKSNKIFVRFVAFFLLLCSDSRYFSVSLQHYTLYDINGRHDRFITLGTTT